MGWAGLMAFVPGFTGLNLGLAPILPERLGLSLGKTSILVVVIVLILSQFLINLAGVRIASRINNVAAGWPSPGPGGRPGRLRRPPAQGGHPPVNAPGAGD